MPLKPPTLELLGDYAPDRINVVMKSPVGSPAAAQVLQASPYAQKVEYLGLGIYSVYLKSGISPITAVAYYSTRPYALTASVDNYLTLQRDPNDPQYSSQWHMVKIGAPTAWNSTTGATNFVVGIVDSGIDYKHQDLFMNIWINNNEIPTSIRNTLVDVDNDGMITFRDLNASANAGKVADNNSNGVIDPSDIFRSVSQGGWLDGIDNDNNSYIDDLFGWDFVNNDNDPMDDNGHGTHVAGTIGAVGNNGVGVTGINWSISLMALKFLNSSGSGLVSRAVMAIDYAINKGVKITNHSWGGATYSLSLAAAIGRARDAGHIIVAAAGNSAQNLDSSPQYPASFSTQYDNVIAVASVNSSDQLASSSNYGKNTVTLAAPGVSILSTVPNNGYAYYSGTSMATPHVTGAIALYWASHSSMSYSQVIDKLKQSVDPIAGLTDNILTGGRLNLGKMFDTETVSGPKVVDAQWSGSSPFTLDRLRVSFDKAIDASTFTSGDIVSFSGPSGGITTSYTIREVSGGGGKVYDIVFGVQSVPGTYSMVIGPDIRDLSGNKMNQNGNGVNGEDPGDCYTATVVLGSSGAKVVDAYFQGTKPRQFDSLIIVFNQSINSITFTVHDIVEFTGPNGSIMNLNILPIDNSDNRKYIIKFDPQKVKGIYRIVLGPDIENQYGDRMNQNSNNINGEVPGDQFSYSQYLDTTVTKRYDKWKINRYIGDFKVIRSYIDITDTMMADDVSVRINIKHSATRDLYIRLIGPNGITVPLFNRHGGLGDNLTNTWFSDSSGINITQGRPPFSGEYRPLKPLSAFANRLAAGRWILEVRDTKLNNHGKLLSWSLVVKGTIDDSEGGGMAMAMKDYDRLDNMYSHHFLPPNRNTEDDTLKDRIACTTPIHVG
jgi:subtilisin family serine protease/subtilisin-like proprotein convertase family protein